jgi:hypothetical protein
MAMQQRTLPAALGLVLGIVAFFSSPVLGFFLALSAVVLGLVGFLLSASPRRGGGPTSLAAIGLGIVGLVFKIVHGALSLIF